MSEKTITSRIINKHDTAENWGKATGFIPKKGEVIVYDIDTNYTYERIKIGDGKTVVSALPFVDDAVRTELLAEIGAVSALVGDIAVSEQISAAIADIPYATDSEILAMMLEEGAFPVIQTEDGSVLCSAENEILMI